MATCEKREIVQPPPPVNYVLTLSAEEAREVYTALATHQGPDSTERFGALTRAINALYNAGVRL